MLVVWASWLIPLLIYLAGTDVRAPVGGFFAVAIAVGFWAHRRGRPLYTVLAALFLIDGLMHFLKAFAFVPDYWIHFALNRGFELMIAAIAIAALDVIKRRQAGKLRQ